MSDESWGIKKNRNNKSCTYVDWNFNVPRQKYGLDLTLYVI